jgi:hypothetical protein
MSSIKSLSIVGLIVVAAIVAGLTAKTQFSGSGSSPLNPQETQAIQAACKINPDSPSCK